MLHLTPEIISWLKETAKLLHGTERRIYMAKTVQLLGDGGASQAQLMLGWDRNTIRKGRTELVSGPIKDNFSARGRKKAEYHLPNLLSDIQKIAEPQCQTDPTFHTQKLYTRLTAKECRKRLLDMGYADEALPTEKCISEKLNALGYTLKKFKR
jgi:predicted exporter